MMKIVIKVILLELILNAICIACVYYLWNWVMPNLILAKNITFLEAWGLRTLVQFCTWRRDYNKK
jgi:hypothetical protein